MKNKNIIFPSHEKKEERLRSFLEIESIWDEFISDIEEVKHLENLSEIDRTVRQYFLFEALINIKNGLNDYLKNDECFNYSSEELRILEKIRNNKLIFG